MPTGNRPHRAGRSCGRRAGFTFIEILVAVGVLASSIPFVSRIFLGSVVAQTYIRNRVKAEAIIDDKKWAIQDLIDRKKIIAAYDDEERLGESPVYTVVYSVAKRTEFGVFFRVNISVSWHETGKAYTLKRALYMRKFS